MTNTKDVKFIKSILCSCSDYDGFFDALEAQIGLASHMDLLMQSLTTEQRILTFRCILCKIHVISSGRFLTALLLARTVQKYIHETILLDILCAEYSVWIESRDYLTILKKWRHEQFTPKPSVNFYYHYLLNFIDLLQSLL